MKIIMSNNNVQSLVVETSNEYIVRKIAELLNQDSPNDKLIYYVLVENNHPTGHSNPKEKIMKIIARDNFVRDDVSDWLVATNVPESMGRLIVNLLNKDNGPTGNWSYDLVETNYELYDATDIY